jgi:hypothetical protein
MMISYYLKDKIKTGFYPDDLYPFYHADVHHQKDEELITELVKSKFYLYWKTQTQDGRYKNFHTRVDTKIPLEDVELYWSHRGYSYIEKNPLDI